MVHETSNETRELTRRDFVALLGVLPFVRFPIPGLDHLSRAGVEHPDPRPGITAEHVLHPDHFPNDKHAATLYAHAAEIPEILDGLYCYCRCKESAGHRSLLVCFETAQAAGCAGCSEEGELAYKLYKEGKTLQEIRKGIDQKYG